MIDLYEQINNILNRTIAKSPIHLLIFFAIYIVSLLASLHFWPHSMIYWLSAVILLGAITLIAVIQGIVVQIIKSSNRKP